MQDFVADELEAAQNLKQGEYLSKIGVDGQVKHFRVF